MGQLEPKKISRASAPPPKFFSRPGYHPLRPPAQPGDDSNSNTTTKETTTTVAVHFCVFIDPDHAVVLVSDLLLWHGLERYSPFQSAMLLSYRPNMLLLLYTEKRRRAVAKIPQDEPRRNQVQSLLSFPSSQSRKVK